MMHWYIFSFASCYNYLLSKAVCSQMSPPYVPGVTFHLSDFLPLSFSACLSLSGFPNAPCSHFQSDCISFFNVTLFNTHSHTAYIMQMPNHFALNSLYPSLFLSILSLCFCSSLSVFHSCSYLAAMPQE